MSRSRTAILIALSTLVTACAPVAAFDPDPDRAAWITTEAEASAYARATPFPAVVKAIERLATGPLVSAGSIGKTSEGRDIPVMVIADPPVAWRAEGPDDAELAGRMPVLLFGSIHAGELCGTEALLMLSRDIVAARGGADEGGLGALLDDLVLLVVPVYNADGHATFGPANRPGQNGPAEMGLRANAQGLDLNRDWIKMDAPETRAMVGVLNAWDPPVIVDTHTTNGSNHRFTLTYQGPKHPAGEPSVIAYVRDVMLPKVDEAFEAATGYDSYFYGNFAENHTKWTTYPAEPWYGVAYRGIRNRLSILTEAYAYASFGDRVLSTRAFCEQVLVYAAREREQILGMRAAADARTVEAGRAHAQIAVKTEARAFAEPATILGYDEPAESGAHSERMHIDFETTPAKDYDIPIFNDFVATETVNRPAAYIVPREQAAVIDRLAAHGVRLAVLDLRKAPSNTGSVFEAERYVIESMEVAERAWEGRKRVTLEVRAQAWHGELREGDVVVRTAQPLGSLASYMLEPRATGGLAAWGLFEGLTAGGPYPVARIDDAVLAELDALLADRAEAGAQREIPRSGLRPITPP
jgi:dipeptidyl-peptidase-4